MKDRELLTRAKETAAGFRKWPQEQSTADLLDALAARLTAMHEEIERKDEALQFTHDTLVKHRAAYHFRTIALAGGMADLISSIVNKTRSALTTDHKRTAP